MRPSSHRIAAVAALVAVAALALSPVAGWPALAAHEAGHALGAWCTGGQVESLHVGFDLAGHTKARGGAPVAVLLGGPVGGVALPAVVAALAGRGSGRVARVMQGGALVVLLRVVLDLGLHGVVSLSSRSDAVRLGAAFDRAPRLVGGALLALGLATLSMLVWSDRYRIFQVSSMGPKPAA